MTFREQCRALSNFDKGDTVELYGREQTTATVIEVSPDGTVRIEVGPDQAKDSIDEGQYSIKNVLNTFRVMETPNNFGERTPIMVRSIQ